MSSHSNLEKETFANLSNSSEISSLFAPNLRKMGALLSISAAFILTALPAQQAQAQSALQKLGAISAAAAMVTGTTGNYAAAKVLGAATAAGWAGSQLGKSNGQKNTLGLVSAGLAGAYVYKQNQEAKAQEILRQAQLQEQLNQQRNAYSNHNNYQPDNLYGQQHSPVYNGNPSVAPSNQTSMELYRVVGEKSFSMTMDRSPAVQQFRSAASGAAKPLQSDELVNNSLNQTFHTTSESYEQLNAAARKFQEVSVAYKTDEQRVARLMQYSTSSSASVAVAPKNTRAQDLYNAKVNLSQSLAKYVTDRGAFFRVADNAALEGFDISPYAEGLKFTTSSDFLRAQVTAAGITGVIPPTVNSSAVNYTMR